MVSRDQKKRMTLFVTNRLEDSGRYKILESVEDKVLVQVKPELLTDPSNAPKAYIVLHNSKMPIDDFNRILRENNYNNIFTTNIFYKDEDTFHVRLGKKGAFKGDYRSLKLYSKDQIDRMIHLRGLEKEALSIDYFFKELNYYQPITDRLEEAIRIYDLEPVTLDYSHIGPGDPGYGFVHNRVSTDYKIANEKLTITSGTGIKFKEVSKINNLLKIVEYDQKSND